MGFSGWSEGSQQVEHRRLLACFFAREHQDIFPYSGTVRCNLGRGVDGVGCFDCSWVLCSADLLERNLMITSIAWPAFMGAVRCIFAPILHPAIAPDFQTSKTRARNCVA